MESKAERRTPDKLSASEGHREENNAVASANGETHLSLFGQGDDGMMGTGDGPLQRRHAVCDVQYEPYEDFSYLALSGGGEGAAAGAGESSSSSSSGRGGALSSRLHLPLLPHTSLFPATTEGTSGSSTAPSSIPASSSSNSDSLLSGSLVSHYLAGSMSFPAKLHCILRDPECINLISWLPHGRAWKVKNQGEFESRCLPRYFRHGRFASFMRQVNGWGFKRILSGPDENAYYHEYFLRGLPEISERMRRVPVTHSPNSPFHGRHRGSSRHFSSSNQESTSSSGSGSGLNDGSGGSGLGHHRAIFIPPDFYHISELHPLPDADGNWPEGRMPRCPQARQEHDPQEASSSSAAVAARAAPPSIPAFVRSAMQQQQRTLLPALETAGLLAAPRPEYQAAAATAPARSTSPPLALPVAGVSGMPPLAQATLATVPALTAVNLPVAAAATTDPRALLLQSQLVVRANAATPSTALTLQNLAAASVLHLQALYDDYNFTPAALSPLLDAAAAEPCNQAHTKAIIGALTPAAMPVVATQPPQLAIANLVQVIPAFPLPCVQVLPQFLPQVMQQGLLQGLPQSLPQLQQTPGQNVTQQLLLSALAAENSDNGNDNSRLQELLDLHGSNGSNSPVEATTIQRASREERKNNEGGGERGSSEASDIASPHHD